MLTLPARLPKRVALIALALFFVVAGFNHFVNRDFYLAMMPPFLPAHLALVYLSGMLEILGGIAVMIPQVRALAGWSLVLLLVAVFPANLHMALNPDLFPNISTVALYIRLPIQGLVIAWAYWATRADGAAPPLTAAGD